MGTRLAEIRDRRDSTISWVTKNPILAAGEHGYDLTNGKFKIGDGVRRWNQLPYFAPEGDLAAPVTQEDLDDHINDETPHPAYDDGISLVLLYENAKV